MLAKILIKRKRFIPSTYLARQCIKFILFALCIMAATYSYNHFKLANHFPIKTVRIYGVNRADHQALSQLLLPLVNGGFFTVDVDYIHDRILQMPWIASVYVRRNWPDQINITVTEKNAVAEWYGDGKQSALLSEGGELFSPEQSTYPAHLPVFDGPAGQQLLMLQYYRTMSRILAQIHAKIATLELTPYLTWKLVLDNGIALEVGHQAILSHLAAFVKVYPQIVGDRAQEVDYVDLRYANGVAVRWKEKTHHT